MVGVVIGDAVWLPPLIVSTLPLTTQFSKHVLKAHDLLGTVLGANAHKGRKN